MIYCSLFLAAFVAATLLPFSSEAILSSYVLGGYWLPGLWCAATLGNSLGSVVNWWLGNACLHWQSRAWFPFKVHKLARAQAWFQRYGYYSLLLAWLPIVGDPLTFVAGVMRARFWPFFLLVLTGKGLRYWLVIVVLRAATNTNA